MDLTIYKGIGLTEVELARILTKYGGKKRGFKGGKKRGFRGSLPPPYRRDTMG